MNKTMINKIRKIREKLRVIEWDLSEIKNAIEVEDFYRAEGEIMGPVIEILDAAIEDISCSMNKITSALDD